MSWYKDITRVILKDLEGFAMQFLRADEVLRVGKGYFVNPCPYCGANDAFHLQEDMPAFFCFSCSTSGNLIKAVEDLPGNDKETVRKELTEWANKTHNARIQYNAMRHNNPEQEKARERAKVYRDIGEEILNFYQRQLQANPEIVDSVTGETFRPKDYLIDVRGHTEETLEKFRVGYVDRGSLLDLIIHLKEINYKKEDIDLVRNFIYAPEGMFLFPYFDDNGIIARINAKRFVMYCNGEPNGKDAQYKYKNNCDHAFVSPDSKRKDVIKAHEDAYGHSVNMMENFSRGDKDEAFFYIPKDIRKNSKKFAILVEGENDAMSVYEALQQFPKLEKQFTVLALGGNIPASMLKHPIFREFQALYEAFDNDEAGDRYRERLDEEIPDVPVYSLQTPMNFDDVDQMLQSSPEHWNSFNKTLNEAKHVPTNNGVIEKLPQPENSRKAKQVWRVTNRAFAFEYQLNRFRLKNGERKYDGEFHEYNGAGVAINKKSGDIQYLQLKGDDKNALKLALAAKMDEHYHNIQWVDEKPQRSFNELLEIYYFSAQQKEVQKQLAWYIFNSKHKQYQYYTKQLTKRLAEDEKAAVLQEVTSFQNQAIDLEEVEFKRLRVAQSLYPINGRAFMYFSKLVRENEDDTREVPCLLTDEKEEIRLDLIKKKSEQSLLIVKDEYLLPFEISEPLVSSENVSLQHKWAARWMNDQIPEEDLLPSTIVREIEAFIRNTYYLPDETVKVLALWIYATYFYTIFKRGFPYLVFNGPKGSGKSTLNVIVRALAFNAVYVVDASPAAMFRQIAHFGCTFLLDEQEQLADARKVSENDMSPILKAGYSETGDVMRADQDGPGTVSYNAFGPKVISNINGVEDVIADRCIELQTVSGPQDVLNSLENPQEFLEERRGEAYTITSRAAISALKYYREVYQIFRTNTKVTTRSARLTQLMQPLLTIAQLVKGDYEESLMQYYENNIAVNKEDRETDSLEGKLKLILRRISEEVLGLREHTFLGGNHIYQKQVDYSKSTNDFTVNALHLLIFVMEMEEGNETYTLKDIVTTMRVVLGPEFRKNKPNAIGEARVTATTDELIRFLDYQKNKSVRKYHLNARQFISVKNENKIREMERQQEQDMQF